MPAAAVSLLSSPPALACEQAQPGSTFDIHNQGITRDIAVKVDSHHCSLRRLCSSNAKKYAVQDTCISYFDIVVEVSFGNIIPGRTNTTHVT
jgi:hypothetical protein